MTRRTIRLSMPSLVFASGLALGLGPVARAQTAGDSPGADAQLVGAEFAQRLAGALAGEPEAWDGLWIPGERDSTVRRLDLRTASFFEWTELEVRPGSCRFAEPGDSRRALVEIFTRGLATWEARAFGVAQAFWTLQLDESEPANQVRRREEWSIEKHGGEWLAASRRLLSPLEIESARIAASVYPGQDALLLECTYYVRSRMEGLQAVRFHLDRRARIYDVEADGRMIQLVRGGELGALGLEGFSPELESSLRLTEPLSEGEETLLKFRILSPLVHLTAPELVTSLPIREGPFRERVWIPVLDGGDSQVEIDLELRWPHGIFAELALAAGADLVVEDASPQAHLEETALRFRWTGDPRLADFVLARPGASLETVEPFAIFANDASARTALSLVGVGTASGVSLSRFERPDAEAATDVVSIRTRRELVAPLLQASTYSSQDLTSEVDELLPLDADLIDLLDDLFDESDGPGDTGAEDRSAE